MWLPFLKSMSKTTLLAFRSCDVYRDRSEGEGVVEGAASFLINIKQKQTNTSQGSKQIQAEGSALVMAFC